MTTATDGGSAPASDRNPFHSPRFRRWWLASIVAGSGIGIQTVTVPLYIRDRVDLENRALAISAALVVQTLPGALLALFGGTIADRVERRRILVRTFGIAAVVSVAYVLLTGLDVRLIWPVFPLAAIVGAAGAFTNPARQSMLPQIVTPMQLQNGVIFGTMGFMATLQFLGPSLGGLTVEGFGLTVAFALEVVLLALAALFFATVRTPTPEPSGRDVLGDLVDGLRYVRGEPVLRGLILMALIPGVFFIGPFSVTLPILVPDLYQVGDKWVGLLWGCFGGGVFLGSVLLAVRPIPRRGLAICLSNISGGTLLLLYGLSDDLAFSVPLLVLWGLGGSVFMNYVVALLQQHSDPQRIGRVMSMYSLIFFSSMPIGYGAAGLITRFAGPQATLIVNGVAAMLVGFFVLSTQRSVRKLV